MIPTLDAEAIRRALTLRDLTDPTAGPHALQILLDDVLGALAAAWRCELLLHRECPIVSVADNYDRLRYPPGGAARDARYTRYIGERTLLRTQTSAMIPRLLEKLAGRSSLPDVLLACPGLVYRRDAIDRLHTGEPHQVDLWRVRPDEPLGGAALREMVDLVVAALLPGQESRTVPAAHPYTLGGLQIDVRHGQEWVEIGEGGLALPVLLADCGLDPARVSGLAMGIGLDRVVMLRKGIDDIRLLRSRDPRVTSQLTDLTRYRPISSQPAIRRDLSIAVEAEATIEELGDRVRAALGDESDCVEELGVASETPHARLPPQAIARLGLAPGQKNVLLRVVLRHPERTLTHPQANALRDQIYAAVHQGTVSQWANPARRGAHPRPGPSPGGSDA